MADQLKGLPLAVFRRREAGQQLAATLEGEISPVLGDDGKEVQPGYPPVVVVFRVPSPIDVAEIEGRARASTLALLKAQGAGRRYGMDDVRLTDETVVEGLAPLIAAIESATALIVDWNIGEETPEGPVKRPVTVETVAELFQGRPMARSAWLLHYDQASPLERAEGNVFAASPPTTSATAATTADAAPPQDPPAPAAVTAEPEGSVPAP